MKSQQRLTDRIATGWSRLREELHTEVARSSRIVLSGHLGRLLLGLVSSAVLARGLGPEGLSIFSVIGATMSIIVTVADFGLRNSAVHQIAVELARAPQRAHGTASAYALLKVSGSMLATGLVILLGVPIARALDLPANSGRTLIWVASLSLLTTGLGGLVGTVLHALGRFRAMVAMQIANTVLTIALMGGLFLLARLTVTAALLVGSVTAALAAGLGFFTLTPGWRAAIVSWNACRRSPSRRLLSFSKWLWISAILSILSTQLDLLLLNHWATPQTVGHYALARNLAFKADIINQTLHTVLLPRVSALSGRAKYLAYVRRSLTGSVVLGLALLLALPLARPFILTVYGPAFRLSVRAFYLTMTVVMLDLLTVPVLLLAYPLDMGRLIAASHAVRVAGLVGTATFLIPGWGIYGAAAAKIVGKLAGAIVMGVAIAMQLREGNGVMLENVQSPDANSAPSAPPPGAK